MGFEIKITRFDFDIQTLLTSNYIRHLTVSVSFCPNGQWTVRQEDKVTNVNLGGGALCPLSSLLSFEHRSLTFKHKLFTNCYFSLLTFWPVAILSSCNFTSTVLLAALHLYWHRSEEYTVKCLVCYLLNNSTMSFTKLFKNYFISHLTNQNM